jgi:hypothetical protein
MNPISFLSHLSRKPDHAALVVAGSKYQELDRASDARLLSRLRNRLHTFPPPL